jgi:hypothetical protein
MKLRQEALTSVYREGLAQPQREDGGEMHHDRTLTAQDCA